MYGMINQAIKTMVIDNVDAGAWDDICSSMGISNGDFDSLELYDDQITLDLVVTISKKLEFTAADLLVSFGEYWVSYALNSEYKTLLSSFGESALELINSLDALHTRLELTFGNLEPPSFHTTKVSDHEAIVHYNSNRDMPLEYFVKGLLLGIFNMFNQSCTVELLDDPGDDKARLKVTY